MLSTNVDSETQEMITVEKEENLVSGEEKKNQKNTVPQTSLALNPINNGL